MDTVTADVATAAPVLYTVRDHFENKDYHFVDRKKAFMRMIKLNITHGNSDNMPRATVYEIVQGRSGCLEPNSKYCWSLSRDKLMDLISSKSDADEIRSVCFQIVR